MLTIHMYAISRQYPDTYERALGLLAVYDEKIVKLWLKTHRLEDSESDSAETLLSNEADPS